MGLNSAFKGLIRFRPQNRREISKAVNIFRQP